jgi:hypothetical protein
MRNDDATAWLDMGDSAQGHGRRLFAISTLLALLVVPQAAWSAEPPDSRGGPDAYRREIRPLLERYCYACHGAELAEGDVDFSRLAKWEAAAGDARTWERVDEMLANRLMPPEEADQPTEAELAQLQQWVGDYLAHEAEARAGDPGPVILRRLNNAEYTYTLRDLTGVASLDPAREFPADGAAGEGFSNVGSALAMSPALVEKYLDAARSVADHAVLLPDGVRFSPFTTPRDWTDEILAEIRGFYGEFTKLGGGSQVNLQGIVFETNQGGVLPLESYLRATLSERERLLNEQTSVEAVARAQGLNAKYLGILWNALTAAEPSYLLGELQQRWQASTPDNAAALVADVAAWQGNLWAFANVGLIGRRDGPKRWMEPVGPLIPRQELRLKLPDAAAGAEITISLVVSDAGDGAEGDVVVWKQPRLVAEGQPDVLLHDVKHEPLGRDADGNAVPIEFGVHPGGHTLDSGDLCVRAPAAIEIRLPADVAAGREFVVTAQLDDRAGGEGSVQLAIVEGSAAAPTGLQRGQSQSTANAGPWSAGGHTVSHSAPIVVSAGSAAERRWQQAFADYRELFPAALCYTQIVPVDEVISVTLFYREDDHLVRLMLDDAQRARLDRLWDELRFVSCDALASVDAFEQLMEFATQDADPSAFEPLRQPVAERAAALEQLLLESEPKHLAALVDFAARAYRRPLTEKESADLNSLYANLRSEGLPHDEAFRLTLARILSGPAFLYRLEKPAPGDAQGPVTDWELAARLSYFLWSSLPDDELRAAASGSRLREPDVLLGHTRRMLRDAKTRRLATEFAGHWLHIHDFENLDEKSERHFPKFSDLCGDMAEEAIRFFADLFQNDGSVLDILDADYTFLNEELAAHYEIPSVEGDQWRRVDGVKRYSRGGVLAFAATLSKQSGASRTSPILRGNWVSETLLGERLPDPPPGIPPLPDDEAATDGLTVRQLVERHVSDPACSNCHRRIDPYGFSLEAFDAIGRIREADLGNRPIDTHVTVMDGSAFDGLDGLRQYLLTQRRDDFVRQFCRKLLGYALGRTVQLSDEPLLAEMQEALASHDYAVGAAVEAIVLSPQFREIRGVEQGREE